MPTRVPQGFLKVAAYLQATMVDVLDGFIGRTCLVWVDDIVVWARGANELLCRPIDG